MRYYEHCFFNNNEEFGLNGILGQPPSIICDVEFFPYIRMKHELAVRSIHIRQPTAPILEHELAQANITRIGISEEMTVEETTDEISLKGAFSWVKLQFSKVLLKNL